MNQKGFSLIELMLVIVIIGILAAIAIPQYSQYTQKARRTDAHNAIMALHTAQQRLRNNCRFYAATLGTTNTCNNPTSAADVTINFPSTSDENYYNIALSNVSSTAYTITADSTGAQAGDTGCDKIILYVNNADGNGDISANGLKRSTNSAGTQSSLDANMDADGCW